ncbi:DUF2635 domain-containing protein [Oceanobacter kriegii]|uniref:DUF2635 domain-containing protein n=1 Tax=Oceanobacter kriegii TaxID=64972 RepID=UPI0003F74DE7|nr:DUF2635 domain-containing protein [Oceanobacter kriegii]
MKTMNVKPAQGKQVRTESGSLIAAAGQAVPATTYYRRRVKDGDLVLISDTAADKKGAAK